MKPIRICPGSPWENGYNERFNGTLRREVLNAEWFTTTRQAQVVINCWLKEYNYTRPHQALGMRPPVPETLTRSGPWKCGWTDGEKVHLVTFWRSAQLLENPRWITRSWAILRCSATADGGYVLGDTTSDISAPTHSDASASDTVCRNHFSQN
ncbi:integrase core domain-containing protein [Aliiruegeria lutimaris]|uniref:integrase core domain-containing protein n=1 Tax=Aliiruegeria lutimaris TaxID=571298 RepID=UPI003CC7A8FD